jgi:hypothetical protein
LVRVVTAATARGPSIAFGDAFPTTFARTPPLALVAFPRALVAPASVLPIITPPLGIAVIVLLVVVVAPLVVGIAVPDARASVRAASHHRRPIVSARHGERVTRRDRRGVTRRRHRAHPIHPRLARALARARSPRCARWIATRVLGDTHTES